MKNLKLLTESQINEETKNWSEDDWYNYEVGDQTTYEENVFWDLAKKDMDNNDKEIAIGK
ncbi:MAG: hypothetical protein LKG25_04560 [Prevotella sp.]|jgi:hypothetical protein|nr:hypothetical protein [Prevotella sp.]MCI1281847.1 hypothetical protein [Prevotella sp.]